MYTCFFFFKQKTAYELRISDWSSDVCSSDLADAAVRPAARDHRGRGVEEQRPGRRAAAAGQCVRELVHPVPCRGAAARGAEGNRRAARRDRKSVVSGKSVSVRVDLGGRRILNKKTRSMKKDRLDTQEIE